MFCHHLLGCLHNERPRSRLEHSLDRLITGYTHCVCHVLQVLYAIVTHRPADKTIGGDDQPCRQVSEIALAMPNFEHDRFPDQHRIAAAYARPTL